MSDDHASSADSRQQARVSARRSKTPRRREAAAAGRDEGAGSDAAFGSDLELPKGWHLESLLNLVPRDAPILYGILQPGPHQEHGVPYVRPTEIVGDVIDLAAVRRTTHAIAAKYKRSVLRPDDVLLSIVGTIGKVAIVPTELEGGNITQSSVRIRPQPSAVDSRYLAWALRSPFVRAQFDAFRLGSAVPRLNVAHVRQLVIPLAPRLEQERIVAEIEKQFSRMDVAVAALDRVRANIDRFRRSVLTEAFECVPFSAK